MICTSGFTDDVTSAHNGHEYTWRKKRYTQSDSTGGGTVATNTQAGPPVGGEVWYLRLPCFVVCSWTAAVRPVRTITATAPGSTIPDQPVSFSCRRRAVSTPTHQEEAPIRPWRRLAACRRPVDGWWRTHSVSWKPSCIHFIHLTRPPTENRTHLRLRYMDHHRCFIQVHKPLQMFHTCKMYVS